MIKLALYTLRSIAFTEVCVIRVTNTFGGQDGISQRKMGK